MTTERGSGECVRCQDYKGGCAVHERCMRKEMARYFRLALYAQSFDRDYDSPVEWVHATKECSVMESVLASFMMVFSKDYGAPRHTPGMEEGKDVALKHGRLDIAYEVEALFDRSPPARILDRNYFTLSAGGKYFTMGAVFDFAVAGHQFCCLFEDGTYFLSDIVATTTTTTTTTEAATMRQEGPLAQKLQRIKGLVGAIGHDASIPPPSLIEGGGHHQPASGIRSASA